MVFSEYVKNLRKSVQQLTWTAAIVATEAPVLLSTKINNPSAKQLSGSMTEIMQNIVELHKQVDSVFANKASLQAANQQAINEVNPSRKR